MDNLSPRVCLQCGKALTGRTDKKFCDAYCRNSFNNTQKSTDELLIQTINRQQRLNRRILKSLCPEGKATVRKEVLLNLGFDFAAFTSMYPWRGKVYYLCYDFGFMPLIEHPAKQKVLIVKKQDYMDAFDPWKYIKS